MTRALPSLVASLILLLAGCTGPPEVGTLPLDLPAAGELLPAEVEGYALGYTTSTPTDGGAALDSLTRVFDGSVNGTGMQLGTTVARYAEEGLARDHFAFVVSQVDPAGNATTPLIGDDARLVTASEGLSHVLVVRRASVFWLAQHSVMGGGERPPAPDLVALLAPYVARVP